MFLAIKKSLTIEQETLKALKNREGDSRPFGFPN
jgi:hypothetical protein